MARYLGPTCKLSRREGTDLFLKSGVRPLDSKCKADTIPGEPRRGVTQVPDLAHRPPVIVDMTRTHVTVLLVLLLLSPATATAQPPDPGDAAVGPLRVETLELEPTVVKTGDLITQRYRVKLEETS